MQTVQYIQINLRRIPFGIEEINAGLWLNKKLLIVPSKISIFYDSDQNG